MPRSAAVTVTSLTMALVLAAAPAIADDRGRESQAALMEALVDNYIAACEAKSGLNQSRSAAMRRHAALYSLKGSYCTLYREELVQAMIEEDLEAKPYKVNRFLNQRFYETVHSRSQMAQK